MFSEVLENNFEISGQWGFRSVYN